MFTFQVIQWNLILVLCLDIWWRHGIWKCRILKFNFLKTEKGFWSEIKNIFPGLTSALKRSSRLWAICYYLRHNCSGADMQQEFLATSHKRDSDLFDSNWKVMVLCWVQCLLLSLWVKKETESQISIAIQCTCCINVKTRN